MNLLTSSPAASPSDSPVEEFPVQAEEAKATEALHSASATEPKPEEIPSEPEEPPEIEAPPAIPVPLLRANMISREVLVRATGIPPEKNELERQLFNEETTSVLVDEAGGVIRLSAAVTPGQLLLLANVETKREVIVQVVRKRAYKPTICYLEMEFAEPAPRFWGMEFSAATALLPKHAQDAEAAAMVISAETTADQPGVLPPAPSAGELQTFKREVEDLRGKPILTETSEASQEASAVAQLSAEVSKAAPTPAAGVGLSSEAILKSGVDAASVALRSRSLPIEHDPPPPQWTTADQAELPKPSLDFSNSLPKSRRLRRARGSFTPGFRGGALRLGLLTAALVITVVGAAWFKHWIPWQPAVKKTSVSNSASAANAKASHAPGSAEANSEFGNTRVASDAPVTSAGKSSQNVALANTALPAPANLDQPGVEHSGSSGSVVQPAVKRTATSKAPAANRSAEHPVANATAAPVLHSATESGVVPPKLIKSVRAVASLEALRDFETGNVVIDAVVGTGGEVNFVSVISGPPSLRASAVESLKQYQYEPATRNGQPVPAHVTITIHFRFEP